VPQLPQFAPSVVKLVQTLLHAVCPLGHEHALAAHVWPVGQAVLQTPQFCTLLVRSTQLCPHCWSVPQPALEQAPCKHT
jgi:hypothetical protein